MRPDDPDSRFRREVLAEIEYRGVVSAILLFCILLAFVIHSASADPSLPAMVLVPAVFFWLAAKADYHRRR